MWILAYEYKRGAIARVKNPEAVPAGLRRGVWTDEHGDGYVKGAEGVIISRAKDFPRRWNHEIPGSRWWGGKTLGWHGPSVEWDGDYFVTCFEPDEP